MHTFELEFIDDGQTKFPIGARAVVRVKMLSGWGGAPPRDITADCATAKELDEQIDRLIAELEQIRKEGHRKFSVRV
jgi:hypothetical protein